MYEDLIKRCQKCFIDCARDGDLELADSWDEIASALVSMNVEIARLTSEWDMLRKMQPVQLDGDAAESMALALENAELREQLARLKAECDAAVNDLLLAMRGHDPCIFCAHCCVEGEPLYRKGEGYMQYCSSCNDDFSRFEWRGIRKDSE